MLFCKSTCFIAVIFIVSKIAFIILTGKKDKTFENSLDEKQKKVYENIINERKNLSIYGYMIGLILSIILLAFRYYSSNKKLPSSKTSGLCIAITVTFLTQYFYYILSPKSNWMITNLSNDQQREEWLRVYRSYQKNYHFGVVIGIVGAAILGYSFNC